MISEVMSSEESTSESDNVFVKPLPLAFQNFFNELDKKAQQRKISINESQRTIPPGLPFHLDYPIMQLTFDNNYCVFCFGIGMLK